MKNDDGTRTGLVCVCVGCVGRVDMMCDTMYNNNSYIVAGKTDDFSVLEKVGDANGVV